VRDWGDSGRARGAPRLATCSAPPWAASSAALEAPAVYAHHRTGAHHDGGMARAQQPAGRCARSRVLCGGPRTPLLCCGRAQHGVRLCSGLGRRREAAPWPSPAPPRPGMISVRCRAAPRFRQRPAAARMQRRPPLASRLSPALPAAACCCCARLGRRRHAHHTIPSLPPRPGCARVGGVQRGPGGRRGGSANRRVCRARHAVSCCRCGRRLSVRVDAAQRGTRGMPMLAPCAAAAGIPRDAPPLPGHQTRRASAAQPQNIDICPPTPLPCRLESLAQAGSARTADVAEVVHSVMRVSTCPALPTHTGPHQLASTRAARRPCTPLQS